MTPKENGDGDGEERTYRQDTSNALAAHETADHDECIERAHDLLKDAEGFSLVVVGSDYDLHELDSASDGMTEETWAYHYMVGVGLKLNQLAQGSTIPRAVGACMEALKDFASAPREGR